MLKDILLSEYILLTEVFDDSKNISRQKQFVGKGFCNRDQKTKERYYDIAQVGIMVEKGF